MDKRHLKVLGREDIEEKHVDDDPNVAFNRTTLLDKLAKVYHLMKEPHFSSTPNRAQANIASMRELTDRIRDIQGQAGWQEACRQCREPCCHAKISNLTSFPDLVLLQLLQVETDLSEAAFSNRTRIEDCLWLASDGCSLDTHPMACATNICPDPASPVDELPDEIGTLAKYLWDNYREISVYINEGIDKSPFYSKEPRSIQ